MSVYAGADALENQAFRAAKQGTPQSRCLEAIADVLRRLEKVARIPRQVLLHVVYCLFLLCLACSPKELKCPKVLQA